MFKITLGKGFQLTFENGWTVSVQFGANNYCENRNHSVSACVAEMKGKGPNDVECVDAEIAAWDKDGKWFSFGADEVKGRCTADQVAYFITGVATGMCASMPEQMRTIANKTVPRNLSNN